MSNNLKIKNEEFYQIIVDLYNYEKHFYKTNKKSDFDILEYHNKLINYFDWDGDQIDYIIKIFSKYTKNYYYITAAEILDRLVSVNNNFNIKIFISKLPFDIDVLYCIRNTKLFLMISEYLSDSDIVKNVQNSSLGNTVIILMYIYLKLLVIRKIMTL